MILSPILLLSSVPATDETIAFHHLALLISPASTIKGLER